RMIDLPHQDKNNRGKKKEISAAVPTLSINIKIYDDSSHKSIQRYLIDSVTFEILSFFVISFKFTRFRPSLSTQRALVIIQKCKLTAAPVMAL
ncbi:hypothetical protein, partial [Klebsiella pneumoniae]|uniref:hypothetical protein n=1 Tax=Klebsiella pneumoniae TaxID=573 RepID=UPI00200FC731